MTKGLGDIMKQAQRLQSQMLKLQEELSNKTVEATAGGGMVTAVVNGKQELVSLRIDPQVVNPSDVEMLQDLIIAAVNEGVRRARGMWEDAVKGITGGLSLPGLF